MSDTTNTSNTGKPNQQVQVGKGKKPKPRKSLVAGAVTGEGKIYVEPVHETQLAAGTFDIDVTGYQMMDGKGFIIEMFKVLQNDYRVQLDTCKSQEQKVRMVVDFLNEVACNYDACAYAYVLGVLSTTYEPHLFTQAYMVGKRAPLVHKSVVPILNALMPLAGLPVLNVYHVLQQIKEASNQVKVITDDVVNSMNTLNPEGAAAVLSYVYDTTPGNLFFQSIGEMMVSDELRISQDSSYKEVVASLGYTFVDSIFEYTIKPSNHTQMWYFQSQYIQYNVKVRHASFALVKHKTTFLTAGATSSQHLEILARVNSIVDYRLRSFQHYIDISDHMDIRSTFKRSLAVHHQQEQNIPVFESHSFHPAPAPMVKINHPVYPNTLTGQPNGAHQTMVQNSVTTSLPGYTRNIQDQGQPINPVDLLNNQNNVNNQNPVSEGGINQPPGQDTGAIGTTSRSGTPTMVQSGGGNVRTHGTTSGGGGTIRRYKTRMQEELESSMSPRPLIEKKVTKKKKTQSNK